MPQTTDEEYWAERNMGEIEDSLKEELDELWKTKMVQATDEEWDKAAKEIAPLFKNWGKEKREAMEARGATRNSELLESFVKYCQEHPELRFWQALRNWSGFSFVLVSEESNHADIDDILDTFYFEKRNE